MENKESNSQNRIFSDADSLHIAIIMDGNGRWAKKQLKPRIFGHTAGMNKVKEIALYANSLGIKYLTLYAFSTENWKRPEEEVSFLMKLPIDFFGTFMPDLIENNVQVKMIGDISGLPKNTQNAVNDAIKQTDQNTGLTLTFAMNYGGQQEIVQATKNIAQAVLEGNLKPEDISTETIFANLQTSFMKDSAKPDLIIRTSGEQRLSNYLLFQSAYSEFYFTDRLWPDFSTEDFDEAINSFIKRDRRFGKIKL